MENEKKKNVVKNVVIIILAVIVLLLGSYLFLLKMNVSGIDGKSTFVKDTLSLQNKVSYYIGGMFSDTFGIYTKEELLLGKTKDGKEITDNENHAITPLVSAEGKIEKNGTVSYPLNEENAKKILNINIPKEEGITWYIQEGELLKVNISKAPSWWSLDLDCLKVGSK